MGPLDRVNSPSDRIVPGITKPALRVPQITDERRFEHRLEGAGRSRGEDRHQSFRDGAPDEPVVSEAARRRTLEELRTIVHAVQLGETDPEQLTDLLFYARHPDMVNLPLTGENEDLLEEWNAISSLLVNPILQDLKSDEVGLIDALNGSWPCEPSHPAAIRMDDAASGPFAGEATRPPPANGGLNEIIERAVSWCPGLSPSILKELLVQESNLNPAVINEYGYAGIAQLGRGEAREAGLHVGIAGSRMDERLNPYKAIPAAARLLEVKAQRLGATAFARYGQPSGIEFWNFVLAAYNGGEGTIALAMGHAHRLAVMMARAKGLVGTESTTFAANYASRWENIVAGGSRSPLALAVSRYYPDLAAAKYLEIRLYPTSITDRMNRMKG